ncbi:IclR family transcriptional regulator [Paenibacillus sp. PAMC21692]|uniref:IclR family transcriptional regulator n=1 Tax=Paenibacillus sp. PAMC21692 TaxID=2762320 RepID=UPI00164DA9DB|nr:IclR family transcriptional regulator [Paenibacillus sp. PAMC21692]QNK56416.1 IclR family transcriptional regulator [Paenibacillus sp. PAMC21692]
MTDNKYWVPAIERADRVLRLVAEHPGKLRLMELSKRTEINKSSMFFVLNTLEKLNWVRKDKDDMYWLGPAMGSFVSGYVQYHDLIDSFHIEAALTKSVIEETVQLAELAGTEVLYLAKEEYPGPVKLMSEPGMRLPALSTALGKVLLAARSPEQVAELYSAYAWQQRMTPNTIADLDTLEKALTIVRERGYAEDLEEAVQGFCCIAVPITRGGQVVSAVSCSMLKHRWETKGSNVLKELKQLSARLSF